VLTERPNPTRLFLKKSRTSLPCPVQSRSENALDLAERDDGAQKRRESNPTRVASTFVERGEGMQEIRFRLWRSPGERLWSIEVNGRRYESVPIDSIELLVRHAIIDAEESLIGTTIH
jgi:hypothetical protein